jgi:hypothetical protein
MAYDSNKMSGDQKIVALVVVGIVSCVLGLAYFVYKYNVKQGEFPAPVRVPCACSRNDPLPR